MNKRILILLLGVVTLAFLFWYSNSLQSEFYLIADFFNVLALQYELLAVLLFIGTAVIGALISPFTNIPLIPFAVTIWGTVPTTIFLLFGWIIGDTVAYLIGRYFGHQLVSKFVAVEKLDEWSGVVKKHTTLLTAFLVRLALPAELGYVFGLVRYNFKSYLFITIMAELPFAIISTSASEAVIFGDIQKFLWIISFLLIIVFGAFIKMKVIKNSSPD